MTLLTIGRTTQLLHLLFTMILCFSLFPNALDMQDQELGTLIDYNHHHPHHQYLLINFVFVRWAIVKDESVARKMVKFMEVSTIGVSKEAQLRAANILEIISRSCCSLEFENFFQHSRRLLGRRWNRLRDTLKDSRLFHLSKYPNPYCNFFRRATDTYPGVYPLNNNNNNNSLRL